MANPARATPMAEHCSRVFYVVRVVASDPVIYIIISFIDDVSDGSLKGGLGVLLWDLVPVGIGPRGLPIRRQRSHA